MTYREKYGIDLNTEEGIKKLEELDCVNLKVPCHAVGCFECKVKAVIKEVKE